MCQSIINSVADFLKWAHDIPYDDADIRFSQYYFRGQANKEWTVTPSLYRKEHQSIAYSTEQQLLQIAIRHAWQYIEPCHSSLERLVMFQHNGLRTRLLDVTTNPLVALFFACYDRSHTDDDGCVYISSACYNATDMRIAYLTAKKLCRDGASISAKSVCDEAKYLGLSREATLKAFSTPFFIEAPFNNSRIVAQRGAFLLTPLLKKCSDGTYERLDGKNLDYLLPWSAKSPPLFLQQRAIIPARHKASILDELSEIGIDESTLFPDLPHLMEAINNERFNPNELKRYTIGELEEVNLDDCKIIRTFEY